MKTILFILTLTFSGLTFANCELAHDSAELSAGQGKVAADQAANLLVELNRKAIGGASKAVTCKLGRQAAVAAHKASASYRDASNSYSDAANECSDTVAMWALENAAKTDELAKTNLGLAMQLEDLLAVECK